jgi:hypothetical protein
MASGEVLAPPTTSTSGTTCGDQHFHEVGDQNLRLAELSQHQCQTESISVDRARVDSIVFISSK